MSDRFAFVVPGRPVSWARTNVVAGRPTTDAAQRVAKRAIALAARRALPRGWRTDRTYALEVVSYYPDRRYGDSDRAVGLVLDALEGIAYRKDRQVGAHAHVRRLDRKRPRVEVTVVAYDEDAHVEAQIVIGETRAD